MINDHLPQDLPHIYSIAKIKDAHIFSEIAGQLTNKEGLSIDEEDNPEQVAAFFEEKGAKQCW